MKIHKEGYISILLSFLMLGFLGLLFHFLFPEGRPWHWFVYGGLVLLFFLVLQFFRSPKRNIQKDPSVVFSPADGRVVTIEETVEQEFFQQPMRQVSIFMSPLNVHLNRYPVDGKIAYYRYHHGKYLVAWHPKSSVLNEHTSLVIQPPNEKEMIMVRQVAGAVARRIVCYGKEENYVEQGSELGFIKFGSRVDLFLPLSAKLQVAIGDHVKGGLSRIATY